MPTEKEIIEFRDWLKYILKDPEGDLKRWADFLISTHDWSASNRIEISGRQTRTGNPEIYTF